MKGPSNYPPDRPTGKGCPSCPYRALCVNVTRTMQCEGKNQQKELRQAKTKNSLLTGELSSSLWQLQDKDEQLGGCKGECNDLKRKISTMRLHMGEMGRHLHEVDARHQLDISHLKVRIREQDRVMQEMAVDLRDLRSFVDQIRAERNALSGSHK